VYVFSGSDDLGGEVDLSTGGGATTILTGPADTDFGVSFSAGACSCRGASIRSADLTGDGGIDLVVGAPRSDRGRGRVYVVPGPLPAGRHDIAALPHLEIAGGLPDGRLGWGVEPGPLDDDGAADLVVAAPWAVVRGRAGAGRTYGLQGPLAATGVITLSDGHAPLEIDGPQAGAGYAGTSIVFADTDGDGHADLHLGLPDDAPAGRRSVGSLFRIRGPVLAALPTATPTATATPSPTVTAEPSATVAPSFTPTPTATATGTDPATATPSGTAPDVTASPPSSTTPTVDATADGSAAPTGGPSPATVTGTARSRTPPPGGPRVFLPIALAPAGER
jgi:hypothetical protein